MAKYYLGAPFGLLRRARREPPRFKSKYNPLQRLAYFSIPIAALFSVATGWAIHKPMQLSWLATLFGGFDRARVWHFLLMCFFIAFVVPHVILVFADGWDTVRSMITGWSKRSEMGGQSDDS
jgi:thiosulfate reductase cytochrome b subunit